MIQDEKQQQQQDKGPLRKHLFYKFYIAIA